MAPDSLTRRPLVWVGGFCFILLVWAAFHRGHSVESIDVRTYAQMIRGVADNGLPYWDNGPVDRFTALVMPWGVAAHGHEWGIYGPFYAYVAAPAFRLGGLALVSQLTFALLCPLALTTFFLARRLVQNEWYAALAAFLVVASTPITAKSLEITAYPLATLLAAVGTYFSLLAIDPAGRTRRAALGSGLVWGAATATHAACFPMALAAFAIMAVAPDGLAGGSSGGLPTEHRVARAVRRLGPAMVGFAIFIVPLAALNHARFGSFNPISYGSMPWTGVVDPDMRKQNIADELRYAAPCVAFAGALAAALWLGRRKRAWMAAIAVAGLIAVVAIEPLRTRFLRFALVAIGFVFDVRWIDMGAPYDPAPDGVGVFFGGFVVKSTLQCTPALILAPLALRVNDERRWPIALLLAPAAALYASLVLRANQSMVDAIGWPWVYIRYTFPGLPLLLVGSVVVVERMRPSRIDALVGATIAVVLAAALWAANDDTSWIKRSVVVVLPIALALAALVAAVARKPEAMRATRSRWPSLLAAAALGLGAAIAVGHDYHANTLVKAGCDGEVDKLERILPKRLALFGVLGQFDVVLSIAATHDLQYADLLRVPGYAAIRPLLDFWRSERRPIYLYLQGTPPNPWTDVAYVPVQGFGDLYSVEFRPAAGSAER